MSCAGVRVGCVRVWRVAICVRAEISERPGNRLRHAKTAKSASQCHPETYHRHAADSDTASKRNTARRHTYDAKVEPIRRWLMRALSNTQYLLRCHDHHPLCP